MLATYCYGLTVLGVCVPWPPAYIIWGMMAADVALTWLGRSLGRWYVLPVGLVLSAYLAVAGLFSVGVLFFGLGLVQIGLLVRHGVRRASAR